MPSHPRRLMGKQFSQEHILRSTQSTARNHLEASLTLRTAEAPLYSHRPVFLCSSCFVNHPNFNSQ